MQNCSCKTEISFSVSHLNSVSRKTSDLWKGIQFRGVTYLKYEYNGRDTYFDLKLAFELCLRNFQAGFAMRHKVHLMNTVTLVDDLPSHDLYRGEVGNVHLMDIVALTHDLPSHDLFKGQVGNVVELFDEDSTCVVRFITPEGHDYASVIIQQDQLMVLRFRRDLYLVS